MSKIHMNVGYTLIYPNGEMNLNYFNYYRNKCIKEISLGYGQPWAELRREGFTVQKIIAKVAP